MNRIARGIVVFTSKGALRLLGVPKEVIPPIELPGATKNKVLDKTARPIAIVGAAGALIYASADERFRSGVKTYFRTAAQAYRRMEREAAPASSSGGSGSGAQRNGSSNGSRLSHMTREELYRLAQQKDIPGRSSMTKDQLKKALS